MTYINCKRPVEPIGAAPNRAYLTEDELYAELKQALTKIAAQRDPQRVLLVPPDDTRPHSRANLFTRWIWEIWTHRIAAIMPALGTHHPMSEERLRAMFGDIPLELYTVHRWRDDVVEVGTIPRKVIHTLSSGRLDFEVPIQINRAVVDGEFDLIISIGQVLPHEVAGMSNYNKNILIGLGGSEIIAKSHWLGAVCGIETIMGHRDTPVRQMLDWASDHFLSAIPLVYLMSVVDIGNHPRGLFMGTDRHSFDMAAHLAAQCNILVLREAIERAVVWLNPHVYRSMWLGNKAIYRLRMAMAEKGELIIIAPGIDRCGENSEQDHLIRTIGYHPYPHIAKLLPRNPALQDALAVAAHLVHGAAENFTVTYCPGGLSEQEVQKLGFQYADWKIMAQRYIDPATGDPANYIAGGPRSAGTNEEKIYFVPDPGIGLWTTEERYHTMIHNMETAT